LAGIANTVLCARVFGVPSGVEIFLIPCVLIAAAFFRPSERHVGFPLIGLGAAIFLGFHGFFRAGPPEYSAAQYADFARLNAASAGTLTVFIGLILAGVLNRKS
jgi:hypothetical protein